MPRRRRRGSPKTRRPVGARPAVGAERRHDAAAPLVEPTFDAPGFERAIRHQPLPLRTAPVGDAPAAAVQRSIDFLRARSIDLAPAAPARGLRVFAGGAMLGAGTTAGAAAAAHELAWHLPAQVALAVASLALLLGLGTGCLAPRTLLLRKLRRLGLVDARSRVAAPPCTAAGDGDDGGRDFASGVVGVVLIVCGAAWLIAAALFANLERWRGVVCESLLLPPAVLAALTVGPALAALLVAGAASGACLPALIGWRRALGCPAPSAGVLAGAALTGAAGGAIIPVLADATTSLSAAPVLLFAAAAFAALPRRSGVACAASLPAEFPLTAGALVRAVPLVIAGAVAATAAVGALIVQQPAALVFALGGAAAGAWCTALARPTRGRNLIALALLVAALIALWLPATAPPAAHRTGPLLSTLVCGFAAAAAALSARSMLGRLRNVQLAVATTVAGVCLGGAGAALTLAVRSVGSEETRPASPVLPSRIEQLLHAGGLTVARVALGASGTAMGPSGIANLDLAGRRLDALLVDATSAEFDEWTRDRTRAARLLKRLESSLRPGGRIALIARDESEQHALATRVATLRIPLDLDWYLARVEDEAGTEFLLLAGRDIPAWAEARSTPPWRINLAPLGEP